MNKKILLIELAVVFVVILLVNHVSVMHTRMAQLEDLLDPDKIGVLFKDKIRLELDTLKSSLIIIEVLIFAVIVGGLLLLILSIKKTRSTKVPVMLLAVTLLLAAIPSVYAENLYYRPRIELPQTITLDYGFQRMYQTATTTMQVRDSYVANGWVAYLLGVGNPNTYEYIEVGYFEDKTGYYIYSNKVENGEFNEIIYLQTSLGMTYTFLVSSLGSSAGVQVDGVTINSITFSNTDNLLYVVQGETTCPSNRMNNIFTELKAGYWKFNDGGINGESTPKGWIFVESGWYVGYIHAVSESPYSVSYTTASPYLKDVTVSGGGSSYTPPYDGGGGGGERPHRR